MLHTVEPLVAQAREKRFSDPAEAMRMLEQAEAICRGALSLVLATMGQIDRDQARAETALRRYEEAAAMMRAISPDRYAHRIRHIADMNREAGNLDAARFGYEEALAIYRNGSATNPLDLANALRGYALLLTAAGETEPARGAWTEAKSLYEASKVEAGVEECERRLAALAASAP